MNEHNNKIPTAFHIDMKLKTHFSNKNNNKNL